MTQSSSAKLAGLTAVVTGSSSGIGRAIALELAADGADCLIHARGNQTGALRTSTEIQQQGRASHAVLADLSTADGARQLFEAAAAWRPSIDIWVNNAGADILAPATAQWSFARKLETLWRVDVLATIELSRAIGRGMQRRGSGVIINIGWDKAEYGMAGDTAELFAATKGAVAAFSKSLAHSLAPAVRVNCVAPGWIKTAWGDQASQFWQERAAKESLAARWGTPEDVAAVVCFLASPAASFITGQVIPVNGGVRQSKSQ